MAHVVGALGLDVVVLTMSLSSEVTLVLKVWQVILQVPVSLLEVSLGVVLNAVHQLVSLVTIGAVISFVRRLVEVLKHSGVVLLSLLVLSLWLFLLLLVVHFLVEEGSLWSKVLR